MQQQFKIGKLIFDNPILNASGCWCLNEKQLDELYSSNLSGVICKTCSIFSKEGNPEPNYYYDEDTSTHFNCKGLPNLGYQYYRNLTKKYNAKPYIISLAFENYEHLKIVINDYDKYVNYDVLMEINLSCPNLCAQIPGYDVMSIKNLLNCLKGYEAKNIKFGLKLPPYFQTDLIKDVCELINEFSDYVKYIVLSNSIPNCLPLKNGIPILTNTYGGMSGKINKHVSLSNVITFSKIINKEIKIVGCGGIDTISDVIDYLTNGADFVQLASCFYDVNNNKLDINKINNVINEYKQHYNK